MRKWLTAITLSTVMLVPVLATGDESDAQIRSSIEHDLWDEEISGITVEVEGKNVTLTGTVDSAWEQSRAVEIARDHDEIGAVENRIEIGVQRTDEELANDVAQKLRNYVHYSIYDDVRVEVRNGVVTLMGDVTWGYKANEMEKMAKRIPGVRIVENEIEVLPASSNDQQLRAAIASRIYGDSLFFRYSTQPTPPIHIIVKNGRVTLTGVVDSEVHRRKAETLARQTFGVFTVDNQLRLSSSSTE